MRGRELAELRGLGNVAYGGKDGRGRVTLELEYLSVTFCSERKKSERLTSSSTRARPMPRDAPTTRTWLDDMGGSEDVMCG